MQTKRSPQTSCEISQMYTAIVRHSVTFNVHITMETRCSDKAYNTIYAAEMAA